MTSATSASPRSIACSDLPVVVDVSPQREIARTGEAADQVAARRRAALVPDDQRHVVHVERQRVAEQHQHQHRDGDGHRQAPRIAQDVQEFLAGDGPDAAQVHRCTSSCGCSARSRASISDTNTSSSDGMIFSIRVDAMAPLGQAAGGRTRRPASPSSATTCSPLPNRAASFTPGSCSIASMAASGPSQSTSSTSSCISSRLQRLGRAAGDQLAAIDQAQPVAVFGLVHVVRGDEDRHALAGHLVDQVPELRGG